LEAAKNKEASLEKAFAWLKSAVFGFGRGREGLKSQLDELATKTPSKLGLEEARKAVEDLAEVAHLVREHLGELEAARSKAEIEQERKEQQAKHDQVVKDASEKARKAKTELDRCLDSIRVLRAQMESPDSGSLPPAQGDQSAADLKVQKARFDDDMRKLEKERVGLETALANHENVASRVFEFKPRKQGQKTGPKGGTSFVAAASAKRSGQVPAEVLPVTGRLMAYQGKRYLAIAKWDELDTGEIESGRLKASLVADLEDE
jgi:Arc/MetJ family transcription regulator